jgi:hypothetical protein
LSLQIVLFLSMTCLSLAALAADPAPEKGPELKEFSPESGAFTVLFPGTPKTHKQTVGRIDNYAFSAEPGKGQVFLVSYFDLPANVQLTLETSVKAYAGGRKGTISSEKKVLLNDEYPGREAEIALPGGRVSRLRLFMVKQRQYQLVVEGAPEFVRSTSADKFLASFRVKD